jgi:protein phosphatase
MGRLGQVTGDHTMQSLGLTGPEAQMLSRAVGVAKDVLVDMVFDAPKPGDVYLLCTDGLTKMVRDSEIRAALLECVDPEETAQWLVDLANAHGGRDNVTAVVVMVKERDAVAPS